MLIPCFGGFATVEAPVAANGLADQFYSEDAPIDAIDVASDFSGGAIDSFALHGTSDALPTGLSLNTSTGEITGTPTTPAAAATIVVEATNAGGSDTTTFDITIRALLVGTLSVAAASATDPTTATGSVVIRVGDLIFGQAVQQTQIDTTGVTDNLGNTYSFKDAGIDGGNATNRMFYSIATVAGTLTAVNVANVASSRDLVVLVGVLAGPFAAIDANPSNAADDTSPVTCPATGTLSDANSVVVCGYSSANSNTVTVSATSPNLLAAQLNSGTVVKAALGYQQVAATTSVAPQFTVDLAFGQSGHCTMSFTRA